MMMMIMMMMMIIVDVLGGVSMDTAKSKKTLLGERQGKSVLSRMEKGVLSLTLNIARSFKVLM